MLLWSVDTRGNWGSLISAMECHPELINIIYDGGGLKTDLITSSDHMIFLFHNFLSIPLKHY